MTIKVSKKYACILLVFSTLQIYGCESRTDAGKLHAAKNEENQQSEKKVMKLNIDMEHQEKSQLSADQGFQPWRNNPVDVAEESIIGLGIGSTEGRSAVLSENDSDAEVRVESNSGIYKVSLKRLVRPDGIWTSTEIEKEK